MKTLKNNSWNRFFHKKNLKETSLKMRSLKRIIEVAPSFRERIGDIVIDKVGRSTTVSGATSLLELLKIHKEMWANGIRNEYLCPDQFDMFRTESIPDMTPQEVYLGDIWGLSTKPIPFWEESKNEGKTGGGFEIYDHLSVYEIILRQYKYRLRGGLNAAVEAANKEISKLKSLGY